MVKHIVLWKMKESSAHGSRKEACAHIKFELESLKNEIEGLVHIEVEPAFNEEGILALYSVFTSRDALDAYIAHPRHLAVREYAKEAASGRYIGDYNV